MACSSVSAWVSAGIVTFLSSVALATGVYGQTGGTVRGTVVDDQGVPVADVSVSFVLQGGWPRGSTSRRTITGCSVSSGCHPARTA